MASKLSGTLSIVQKTKMSLQNQWKLLTQLKGYLNKSEYDKNFQFVMSKEWMEIIQRITYAQIENVRSFSVAQNLKDKYDNDGASTKEKKEVSIDKAVAVTLPEDDKRARQIEGAVTTKQLEEEKGSFQRDLKEQIYAFPQVLSALLPQFNARNGKDAVAPTVPKWKTNIQSNISKHSIASRTRHVLNSIATAESAASKWRRIEDLLVHIEQYPEARHHAIKEGAIGILLRARQKSKDPQMTGN